jgi:hypothetical protein
LQLEASPYFRAMVATVLGHTARSRTFHPVIQWTARIISYIFHPLFIPLYAALFLIYEVRLFPERTEWQKTIVFIQFFVYYTFLPMMTTLLCKALGFVSSIQLKTQKDRIIPIILCEIFYFWGWYVFRNLHFSSLVVMFGLGVFVATSLSLILNAYMKISLHAVSVGVLSAFMVLAGMQSDMNFGPYISIAFLIAGLTATARLIDSDHHVVEVYGGFFAGAVSLIAASFFV